MIESTHYYHITVKNAQANSLLFDLIISMLQKGETGHSVSLLCLSLAETEPEIASAISEQLGVRK